MKEKEEIVDSAAVMANYSNKLHKYAQEIKTGDYINCALVLSATNKRNENSFVLPEIYRITEVEHLQEPIANAPHKELIIKADYICDDVRDLPKNKKLWHYADVIQFSFVELSEKQINPA